MKLKLSRIFKHLYSDLGPQHWWPADSVLEIMVGAILAQNTSWSNVQKAMLSLKQKKLLNASRLSRVSTDNLATLIKSAGCYNLKAARLKNFLKFFIDGYSGQSKLLGAQDWKILRKQLLEVKGIGPETADSILLYALNKPVFVVDAYTQRILLRHGLINKPTDYSSLQDIFMRYLKPDARMFNEYHALLVKIGKDYCRKQNPKCEVCPLWSIKNA